MNDKDKLLLEKYAPFLESVTFNKDNDFLYCARLLDNCSKKYSSKPDYLFFVKNLFETLCNEYPFNIRIHGGKGPPTMYYTNRVASDNSGPNEIALTIEQAEINEAFLYGTKDDISNAAITKLLDLKGKEYTYELPVIDREQMSRLLTNAGMRLMIQGHRAVSSRNTIIISPELRHIADFTHTFHSIVEHKLMGNKICVCTGTFDNIIMNTIINTIDENGIIEYILATTPNAENSIAFINTDLREVKLNKFLNT